MMGWMWGILWSRRPLVQRSGVFFFLGPGVLCRVAVLVLPLDRPSLLPAPAVLTVVAVDVANGAGSSFAVRLQGDDDVFRGCHYLPGRLPVHPCSRRFGNLPTA